MSTGLNCEFLDVDGKWYYILEWGSAPKQTWDWREYASAYGPFDSQTEAQQNLSDNHANPGGWTIGRYMPDERPDAVYDRLIAEATTPQRVRLNRAEAQRFLEGLYGNGRR